MTIKPQNPTHIDVRLVVEIASDPATRLAELFQSVPGAFKFFRNQLFIRQDCFVFGCENLVREIVEGVVGFCGTSLGTQDQANWRVFAGFHPMPAGVVEVHMHLPGVGIAEFINLEIHDQ